MNMEKIIVFLVVVAMVVSVDPTSASTTEMTTIIGTITTAEPVNGTTTEPVNGTTAEPVNGTTTEPVNGTMAVPVNGTTAEPVNGTTTEPVNGTTAEPVNGTTAEPVNGTTAEPVNGTTTEPVVGTTAVPVNGTTAEPVNGTTAEPVNGTTAEPVNGTTAEPVNGTTAKPVNGTTAEPVNGTTTEPVNGTMAVPVDGTTAEPVNGTMAVPVNGTTTEPVNGMTTEPVNGTMAVPVDGTTAEPVNGTTSEPMNGTTAEAVNGTTAEPVNGTTAEPVDGTTTEPVNGTTAVPVDITTAKSAITTTAVLTTMTVLPTEKPKTEAKTEGMTKTTPLKVGPIPEATVPEIVGDFNKTYQFEIAIEQNSTKGCTSDNLTTEACRTFKISVTLELEALYGENSAFVSVDVTLRNGSVIVSHIVTYSYNLMSDEERKMSAQDVYDDTIGKAVENGTLGNYAIEKDCRSCSPPAETSDDICSRKEDITCTYGSTATCETGYWICESKCISDGGYCNGHGICWQEDINEDPICSCDWVNGEWYWGYKCQHHVDQTYLIIGCSCGGAVLLVLLVSIIGYLYAKTMDKSEKSKKSSVEGDDVINAFQNNGFVNGTENIFPPIDDIDDGDILQRRRPYSYIYHKGDDPTDMTSSSFITKQKQNGGVGHEGKRESGLEVIDDSSKRHSQTSNTGSHQEIINSEFWGDSAAEHVKLEPFLTNADDSDDGVPHPNQYKIQRPRISNYYSFGNNEVRLSMDPSGYQGFPEPDYGQR